jgi:hypothetical protein
VIASLPSLSKALVLIPVPSLKKKSGIKLVKIVPARHMAQVLEQLSA